MAETHGGETPVVVANRSMLRITGVALLIAVAIVIILLMVLPTKYYFVRGWNGDVALKHGKLGWLDARSDNDYAVIPLGPGNLGGVLDRKYASRDEALKALRGALSAGLQERRKAVLPLENQLAPLYRALGADLKGARVLGLQNAEGDIKALDAWLAMFDSRVEREAKGTDASFFTIMIPEPAKKPEAKPAAPAEKKEAAPAKPAEAKKEAAPAAKVEAKPEQKADIKAPAPAKAEAKPAEAKPEAKPAAPAEKKEAAPAKPAEAAKS